jgi:hypothetical protein
MATCLSSTDAYGRSAKIDLALKKVIEYNVNKMCKMSLEVMKKLLKHCSD